jgi:hypothetical protein
MSTTIDISEFPAESVPVPVPPRAGSVFALGWLMAQLFDGRRRTSVANRQPAFDKTVQLPLVGDLDGVELLNFLVTDLNDLLTPYPGVSVSEVRAEAAKQPGAADPFDQGRFDAALGALHLAILDELANEQEQLNAYQLGLALSDMCWLGTSGVGPDVFIGMWKRSQVAAMQTWLNGAGTAIPPSSASIVGQSMTKWADWVDVNAPKFRATSAAWASSPDVVLNALRVQGSVWHSVLTADPDVGLQPAMGAWVQAASSIARAARMVSASILRRFWPVVIIGAAALGGLLYLIIANLSGASQTWATLVTVGAIVGGGGAGLGSGVSSAFGGVGYEVWSAAKLDAQAWSVTWLPAVSQGTVQRSKLDSRGVAVPRIRKNVDQA